MLLILLLTLRAESCDVQANSSLITCTDLDAFQLVSDSESTWRTLHLDQCTPSSDAIMSTAVETIDIQCNDSLPVFAFENFSRLSTVVLSNCSLSELHWQSLYVDGQKLRVDLTTCPLDCTCSNEWMTSPHTDSAFSVIPSLPHGYRCSFSHCAWGTLSALPFMECSPGEIAILDVNISASTMDVFSNRKYFSWHMSRSDHNFTEHITRSHLQLVIEPVTEEHLGTIAVVCWHCDHPLMTTIELRVRVPVRARLEERDDSLLVIVSGWPISSINLTIGRSGETETRNLSEDNAVTFFDGLVVRPDEGQSLFYRRVFSVFALACSTCPVDHPAGNYSFEICSTVNCFRLHNYIEHIGNHSNAGANSSVPWSMALPLIIIFLLTPLLLMFLLRLKMMQNCRAKVILMRKQAMQDRVESRRTSRVTEETLLRLEERSSLSSSDYSGQLIPFIDLGTIQIHERIGKGAFGEVYCGSWDKTGERSVAIKTIEADEDVEKEAVVLSRLEHPNIVRLYGMTRDGPRLLLVFERMNLGDLRSYLRARAPTSSSYSQFPPALVEDELRLIVRQIVSGLCYLSTQQIVHRDLAARNCLVGGESDLRCCLPSQRPPITVKISDFGMSRRLYGQADYYRMQNHCLLPVRWLPPEAINDHRFSTSSDVWALGVTMWEVFSYGEIPFAELNNFEMVSYAMAGMRPPKPKSCPAPIYELMQRCWAADPEERVRPEEVLLDPCLTPTLEGFIGAFPT
ncbi:hypothetical protein RB195_021091 [Necator americanus]|uniref:Protein kinase domain-containing protein n=1 Tax=Necator americanus TaxID=51031 RepID=A0ABR1E9B8_NECAM